MSVCSTQIDQGGGGGRAKEDYRREWGDDKFGRRQDRALYLLLMTTEDIFGGAGMMVDTYLRLSTYAPKKCERSMQDTKNATRSSALTPLASLVQ